jgi:transketolase
MSAQVTSTEQPGTEEPGAVQPENGRPDAEDLADTALRIRRRVINMCRGRGQGYAGQGLALADVLAHLYFDAMRRNPDGSYLDRFVLSTGHSAIGLFATLGELGLYDDEELRTYGMNGSRIEESPLEGTPGFEITGGSLGQGLSQAVGMALGERLRGSGARVYCLLSDGELQEGQVWEAAMSASHYGLGNLVALIDNNRMQADGAPADVMSVEPVDERFRAFGFDAKRISAHDHGALSAALPGDMQATKPTALVLETIPGKGVPTFENHHKVHYLRLAPEVWEQALAELG